MLNRRHILLAASSLAGCVASTPKNAAETPSFSKLLLIPMLDERVTVSIVDKTKFSGTLGKQPLPPMTGLNRAVVSALQAGIKAVRPEAVTEAVLDQNRNSETFEPQSRIFGFWTSRNRQWAIERAKAIGADSILLIDDAGESNEYSSKSSGAAVSYGNSLAASEVRIFAAARVVLYRADGSPVTGRHADTSVYYPLSDFQIASIATPMAIEHAHASISRAVRAHMFGAVREASAELGLLRADA